MPSIAQSTHRSKNKKWEKQEKKRATSPGPHKQKSFVSNADTNTILHLILKEKMEKPTHTHPTPTHQPTPAPPPPPNPQRHRSGPGQKIGPGKPEQSDRPVKENKKGKK